MAASPAHLPQRCRYTTGDDHFRQYNSRTTDPSMTRPRRVVGKYFLSKTLGKGSMGKVKLAMNTDTHEKVAVKIVPRKFQNTADQKNKDVDKSREIRTIREASIMLLLDHPNIAKVFEMSFVDNFYYLFMEYVDGGQLLDYIISHGKLKERHARDIARQIASALDYCHRNSIVHRDLKVENILLSRTGQIKIIDFGLSNVFSPKSHLNTFCGSLYFAAPELLDGRVYTGPEVDIWSFGIILYVLVCGQVPFDDPTMGGMHVKVKRGYVDYPTHLSADCRGLLQRMIVTVPKNRATLTEVIFHPWMNRGYDSIVDNHLPKRSPLKPPVDMEVIKGMRGFDFGTEESIKKDLEALISSEEYKQSAKQMEVGTSHVVYPGRRKSLQNVFGGSQHPQQQQQLMPPPAFHPLISVYYLVQEHMQREEGRQTARRLSAVSLTDTPTIGVSYTAEGKKEVRQPTIKQEQEMIQQMRTAQQPDEESLLHMPKLETASTTTSSSTASSAASSSKTTPKPSLFRRLSRRKVEDNSSKRSNQHQNSTKANEENSMPLSPPPPVIINTYHHTHQEQNHNISPVQPQPQQIKFSSVVGSTQPVVAINGSLLPDHAATLSPVAESSKSNQSNTSKWNKLLKRATSVNMKKGHQFDPERRRKSTCGPATLENRQRHAVSVAPIPAAANTATTAALNPGDMFLTLPSALGNPPTASSSADTLAIQQKENVGHNLEPAEDTTVKSVYVKGLFSVSTTSNKKPSEIRKEIIRVLVGNAYIEFRETKDRFECVLFSKPKRARRKATDASNGYFTDEDDMVVSHNERQEQQTLNYAVDDSQAVRFDIYIVKIPWLLGMRGLQFRRVSGDPWHYKNICSKILDSLKL